MEPTDDDILDALAAMIRTGTYGTQQTLLRALPAHLWPTGKRPSGAWLSKQLGLADAKGVLTKRDREALFKAARGDAGAPGGDASGELEGDLGDL